MWSSTELVVSFGFRDVRYVEGVRGVGREERGAGSAVRGLRKRRDTFRLFGLVTSRIGV